jgi:peroxiredoxin
MMSPLARLVALGAVTLGGIGAWALTSRQAPVRIGAEAPSFHAVSVDAPVVERSLADYKGAVVIVNIWATWCEPCLVEMPSLEALHRRYAKDGLKIVGVSVDAPGADAQIRAFRDRLGLTFDVLHDAADIRATYQTVGVPESFVIGRDGKLRRRVFSAENWDSESNRKLVEQLLAPRS